MRGLIDLASRDGSAEAPLHHRPAAVACDPDRAEMAEPGGEEPMDMEECAKHEDCDEGINGRCQHDRMGRQCTYDGCFEDDDCGPGRVCRCRGHESAPHVCMRSGNCQVNADCGEGGFCSPSMGDCGDYVGIIGWFCHTAEDDCVDDVDCGGDGGGRGDYCAFNPAGGRWMCSDSHCDG